MRRIESLEDALRGVVTYALSDGQRFTASVRAVDDVGIAELLRRAGLGHLVPTERVTVMWCGRKAGTVPGDFDPAFIKSKTWLYEPRPGDFTRDAEGQWIATKNMGPGDLEAVPGFVWDREPSTSTPSP